MGSDAGGVDRSHAARPRCAALPRVRVPATGAVRGDHRGDRQGAVPVHVPLDASARGARRDLFLHRVPGRPGHPDAQRDVLHDIVAGPALVLLPDAGRGRRRHAAGGQRGRVAPHPRDRARTVPGARRALCAELRHGPRPAVAGGVPDGGPRRGRGLLPCGRHHVRVAQRGTPADGAGVPVREHPSRDRYAGLVQSGAPVPRVEPCRGRRGSAAVDRRPGRAAAERLLRRRRPDSRRDAGVDS